MGTPSSTKVNVAVFGQLLGYGGPRAKRAVGGNLTTAVDCGGWRVGLTAAAAVSLSPTTNNPHNTRLATLPLFH